MKTVIKFLGFLAIGASLLTACNKAESFVDENGVTSHRVTISAVQATTKTSVSEGLDNASFVWSANDNTRLKVTENGANGTSIGLSIEGSTASITATFSDREAAASYTYNATLAKHWYGDYPMIPAEQTCTATSYDPDADILLGKEFVHNSSTPPANISMQFGRPVVINKMTLNGLDTGDKVYAVEISTVGGEYLTGSFNPSSKEWTGISSTITLTVNRQVTSGNELSVYFVSMPTDDLKLVVNVDASANTYTKTFTSNIRFPQNKMTRFGVNLTKAPKTDYSDSYVLTNASGTKVAQAWTIASGNNIPSVDAALSGGAVYYDGDVVTTLTNAAIITLDKVTDSSSPYYGLYTMVQNGKYLSAASNSANNMTGLDSPTANSYWKVSYSGGSWTIVAVEATYSRNVFLYNSASKLFSCYAPGSSMQPVALYRTTTISPASTISWDLTSDSYSDASTDLVKWGNTGDDIVITNSKGSSNYNANAWIPSPSSEKSNTRIYKDQTITITPQSGVTILSVVFTLTTSAFATSFAGDNWTNAEAAASDTIVTVIPSNGGDEISVVPGAYRTLSNVKVTYIK